MSDPRLGMAALSALGDGVQKPRYDPADHGVGIVHFGCGAFFRAHQAAYTDAALADGGGNWRIAAVNLRSTGDIDALGAQDGLYSLIERSAAAPRVRVIGSISKAIAAARTPQEPLVAMADGAVKLITVTVTEKAYGIDRAAQDIDPSHPSVMADLAHPAAPCGILGYLTEGLRLRKMAGHPPPTILCCDNLPENGRLLRSGVLGFAQRTDPALADYIAENVAFPSTMVDRITPAPTELTRRDAQALSGFRDEAAIETEPFSQWVIEDKFPTGRPNWQAGGALFVADVAPYENMKLRMLNGAHSMLAYGGFLAGHEYVRDVMQDPALGALVRRHLGAAATTLAPLDGMDFHDYADALTQRFANPAIAHQTYQIAMDGTQKLPQRIAAPALDCLAAGHDARPFAFALALWIRYCLGRSEAGEPYDLRDPRSAEISAVVSRAGRDSGALTQNLIHLSGLFPKPLTENPAFTGQIQNLVDALLTNGVQATLDAEATSGR